jgi:hypothetical protein
MTSYTNSPKIQSVPWRDVLPVQPAAELLPRMSDSDLKELGADIAVNGQHTPIVLLLADDGTETLLDGVNRLDAMARAGIEVVKDGAFNHDRVLHQHIRANTDPYRFVLSVNLYRRHLTNEQKTELIAKLFELQPAASDRMIASMTGTSHPTVAKVRSEMAAGGKITTSQTRTDKRGRAQPATKPPKPAATPTLLDAVDDLTVPDFLLRSGAAGPDQHDGADQHVHHSDEHGDDDHVDDVAARAPTPKTTPTSANSQLLYCSFCDKSQEEVHRLIQGSKALICDECVELCVDSTQLSLVKIWQAASATQRQEIIQSEDVVGLIDLMSNAQRSAFSEKIGGVQRHKPSDTTEIAKLAREITALMAHPEQHADAIKKHLARILKIVGPDKAPLAKASNAKLNDELLPRALGLN